MNSQQGQPGNRQDNMPGHILLLNYFTVAFIVCGLLLSSLLAKGALSAILYFSLWLYLVPPLLCRLTISVTGRPTGIISRSSRTHTIWWWLFQLQLPFNRFPFLEELLRSVPGVYALWLNLWGARVSPFSFWSPGVTVMDRYHLQIGREVILGTRVFLSGHLLKKQADNSTLLLVDEIIIEEGALIGAQAAIAPGCHIQAGEAVAFNANLPPYTLVKDGKKVATRDRNAFINFSE